MSARPSFVALLLMLSTGAGLARAGERPNILVAIADDQSWPHASAYGCEAIKTPAFDRVARAGVLFTRAFTPSPGCSPTRAALLTGRNIWQIEHAGTHWSTFPTKYEVYPDLLEQAGYWAGHTGKGWAPGNQKGWPRNPAGPAFNRHKNDYAANFEDFLAKRPDGAPFVFWYGSRWPHRPYQRGSGEAAGIDLDQVKVPPFLPDVPKVRSDLADYLAEIQRFDAHLGKMLDALEKAGELDNTLVIVTSDNGMPFPRAKANLYEYGIHMPLAICWPARAAGGRKVDDLVNLIDLTATIYEATGVAPPKKYPLAGRSLMNLLARSGGFQPPKAHRKHSGKIAPAREAVYFGRERHSSSRYRNWGYPARGIRTDDYLYIRNFHPERWPAGASNAVGKKPHSGYHDIDAGPTLALLVARRDEPAIRRFLEWAVAKRPAEELFDIRADPGCLHNLADDPRYAKRRAELAEELVAYLKATGDPRVGENPEIWETYPRYGGIRKFPSPDRKAGDRSNKPNLILILADDIGYECFGCYGSRQYRTPNIDRLARGGVRFEHCYSQPLCTPSRVKLLTGLSNARNYSAFSILNRDQRTIAHYLQDAGYRTAAVGKWQLLGADIYSPRFRGKGTHPKDAGFDRYCLWQVEKRGERYWGPLLNTDGVTKQYSKDVFGPDVANDYLLDFMEENRDRPFFIYYPMMLVHSPFVPTPDSKDRASKNRQRNFEDMVAYMDQLVGRVVRKTEELGIADRTLILFVGDNGTGRAIRSRLGGRVIRGGKGQSTDAGTRVPLVGYWPGATGPGRVSDDLVDFSDFLPTLLEAAGAPATASLDGRSFLPQLKGEPGNPREWVYIFSCPRPERHKPVRFAREQRWKLYGDGRLFDVANDPREKHPLKEIPPDSEAAKARAKLAAALKQMPAEGQSLLKFAP